MRKELEVAARNTRWYHAGLRSFYIPEENIAGNSIGSAIYSESLMCGMAVHNSLADELCSDGYGISLLGHSPEYILRQYYKEYPELCLILCNLALMGATSPVGANWLSVDANYIFGISHSSPLYHADFYAKNIPIIRITKYVFTLGTNQPQFSTVADVKNYYRDKERIEEISSLCLFWIGKFYK